MFIYLAVGGSLGLQGGSCSPRCDVRGYKLWVEIGGPGRMESREGE